MKSLAGKITSPLIPLSSLEDAKNAPYLKYLLPQLSRRLVQLHSKKWDIPL